MTPYNQLLGILNSARNRAEWRAGNSFRHTRKGEWDEMVEDIQEVIYRLEQLAAEYKPLA